MTLEADSIRRRWSELRRALVTERDALRDALTSPHLQEQQEVQALLTSLDSDLSPAPPEGLRERLLAAIPALDDAHERVKKAQFTLEEEVKRLKSEGDRLGRDLEKLQRQGRMGYAAHIERLREHLTPIVGSTPPLLCELLEIPEERWQNAVEASLGGRRFNVIVPPESFSACLRCLDRARAEEGLTDVGLLDLRKAEAEARPAREGSLAQKVQATSLPLQRYLETVLGDIITCERVEELPQHRRSITPEVVTYSEWTARALPPRSYQPWYIGERAQRSQYEKLERERAQIGERIAQLVPQMSGVAAELETLGRGRSLSNLANKLESDLDERPLRNRIEMLEGELAKLDLSGVEALKQELARLQKALREEEGLERTLRDTFVRGEARLESLKGQIATLKAELEGLQEQADTLRAQHPEAVAGAEALLAERHEQVPEAAAQNARHTAANFSTRSTNELKRLTEESSAFNTRHSFAALAGDPDEARYEQRLHDLEASELPRYHTQIDSARREAEEELREHVLYRLREGILKAKEQLERINDALARCEFRGERYRFRYLPADELRDIYDLIMSSEIQTLGKGSLFESQFYSDHQEAFGRFYDLLTRTPQSDAERREQERLSDYRRYLSYDIEVTHPSGQTSRLSRIMGQTSGGETQTPFYLTIAASFVQLYGGGGRKRDTIRLVAFDEAFSKMDQDRIGATLELFQQFDLQVITATPLERCEYLVPKMCTNLVLTGVGDTVMIEPYLNYEARLGRLEETV